MKSVKIFGLIIGGLVVFVVIGALLVLLLVNPNDFKPKIAAAVKDSTGRQLNLQGDIKLSVFPWVALTLGPASLGNPPGFGDAPFLSFSRAEVRVKLLPLLSKHLEVARVVLDGLDLRLVKKPDGRANWQMNEKGETPKKQPPGTAGGPSVESIAGIAVTHGRVSYGQYVIENLDLKTGAINRDTQDLRAGGSPTSNSMTADLCTSASKRSRKPQPLRSAGDLQHRPGIVNYRGKLHRCAAQKQDTHQHGWTRCVARQCVRRAAMEIGQV